MAIANWHEIAMCEEQSSISICRSKDICSTDQEAAMKLKRINSAYQIGIVFLEINDLNGHDLVQRDAPSLVNAGADSLSHLLA